MQTEPTANLARSPVDLLSEAAISTVPTRVKLSKTKGRLRPVKKSGLSATPKLTMGGPSEGPVFPILAMGAPAFTASPTFTVRLPRAQMRIEREAHSG